MLWRWLMAELKRLSSLKRKPKPAEPTERLIIELPKGSNLDEVLRLIAAGPKVGNNTEVLTAINNLTTLVKEIQKTMATQEDIKRLEGKIGNIEEAAQLIADDVTALKNEIKEANERANIDLSPLETRADNIAARLKGIAGPKAGTDPDAQPVEGGGTGG